MWLIGVEVEQETSAPPPTKNPGSAPVGCAANADCRLAEWQVRKRSKHCCEML